MLVTLLRFKQYWPGDSVTMEIILARWPDYGNNTCWVMVLLLVCLNALLNLITDIVRLCSSIGQLQLSKYTWRWEIDSLAEACHTATIPFSSMSLSALWVCPVGSIACVKKLRHEKTFQVAADSSANQIALCKYTKIQCPMKSPF